MKLVAQKVADLLAVGKAIEASNPDLQQVSFEIHSVKKQDVCDIAIKHQSVFIGPSIGNFDYRTIILHSRVKILVHSDPVQFELLIKSE